MFWTQTSEGQVFEQGTFTVVRDFEILKSKTLSQLAAVTTKARVHERRLPSQVIVESLREPFRPANRSADMNNCFCTVTNDIDALRRRRLDTSTGWGKRTRGLS